MLGEFPLGICVRPLSGRTLMFCLILQLGLVFQQMCFIMSTLCSIVQFILFQDLVPLDLNMLNINSNYVLVVVLFPLSYCFYAFTGTVEEFQCVLFIGTLILFDALVCNQFSNFLLLLCSSRYLLLCFYLHRRGLSVLCKKKTTSMVLVVAFFPLCYTFMFFSGTVKENFNLLLVVVTPGG